MYYNSYFKLWDFQILFIRVSLRAFRLKNLK